MELNYLRAFFDVAKTGSFTEAALRVHVSQSALSRAVALLEDSEGVKLFERTRRGVTLTPVGEEVFRHCQQLFQTIGKIESLCRGTIETCDGPMRFSSVDHVINYLLIDPIQKFRDEFPGVVPEIDIGTPDDVIHSLLTTESEFGLLFAKVVSPQIDYEPLREEPMTLVVQAEVWKSNKGANNGATLQKVIDKVGYISSIGANTQTRPSRVLLELFGRMPHIGFQANGQEAQKRVCLGGGGVAYLSRFMVAKEIADGHLHEIEVDNPHAFKLWLATKKGRVLSTSAKTFLERLRQPISGQA